MICANFLQPTFARSCYLPAKEKSYKAFLKIAKVSKPSGPDSKLIWLNLAESSTPLTYIFNASIAQLSLSTSI